jgi:hypothetical protein
MNPTPHAAVRTALESFRNEISDLYPELVALIAYGSAVSEHFRENHSDVNLLLVLPTVDAAVLARGAETLHRHWKRHRILPLIISEAELRASTDVFAVELLDIKEHHVCLKGADPFDSLVIAGTWLRHQCEYELRGKLLRLRQGYLECRGRERDLQTLVTQALGGVLPMGRALLRMAGERAPRERAELIAALARRYAFEPGPWLEVLELREGRRKKPLRPAGALYADFLRSLDALVNRVNDAT